MAKKFIKQYFSKWLPGIFCFLFAFSSSAQPASSVDDGLNYIVDVTPLESYSTITVPNQGLTNSGLSYSGTVSPTLGIVKCQYYDGKGNAIQESILNSGESTNLTSQVTYDAMGREVKQWLPVPNSEAGGYLSDYEQQAATRCDYPYYEFTWEQSPLSREQSKRGVDIYHSHPSAMSYQTNAANEVKVISVTGEGIVFAGYYNAGTLSKTVITDPDSKQVVEYKDATGRLIMQSRGQNACTYYVYNNRNQLAYVLPPTLSDRLSSGNAYTDSNNLMKLYAYSYRYDHRGNICYKRLPGCDPIYFLYDKSNRLVMQQDGNQRNRGRYWTAFAYDSLGRMAYSVEIRTSTTNVEDLQNTVENADFTTSFSTDDEDMHQLGTTGYTCEFLPGTIGQLLTVTYYDSYDFLYLESNFDRTKLSRTLWQGYMLGNVAPFGSIGLTTGKRVYNLKDGSYTVTSYYYDSRDRLVQQHTKNALGGYDRMLTLPSFTGKTLKQRVEHSTAFSATTEEYTFVYDNLDRVIETRYKHDNDPEIQLSSLEYDAYGQIAKKRLINCIDSLEYNYDFSSHPTRIHAGSGFEENLYYGTRVPGHNTTPCYNGNISASTWTYGAQVNGYTYSYDSYNRLSSANTIPHEGLSELVYSESFQYDKQGNITYLTRWNNEDAVNGLNFTYYGNQLSKVTDAHHFPTTYGEKRYFDNANFSDEMYYDNNGNLRTDFDRNICVIRYNVLNLPDTIQFSNGDQIVHMYDALGTRLQTIYYTRKTKLYTPPMGPITNTDNLQLYNKTSQAMNGNCKFIREGNGSWRLDYVFNPEGYMRYYGPEEHYAFYYIKDHLGNVREVYVNPAPGHKECIQRTQYYPSGLPWKESMAQAEQPYKYGGKEFVEMHGLDEYDSEARWYYPAIMRTTTMDPLCEKYYSTSPYAWCGNNPVIYVDLHGDSLSVRKTDREDLMTCLVNVYGETVANNFGYTKSGKLVYNGDVSEIKNKKVRRLVKDLVANLLSPKDEVSLVICSGDVVIPSTGEMLSKHSGGAYDPSTNTIYIDKLASSSFTVNEVLPSFYENNGIVDGKTIMFRETEITTNLTDRLFHEFGEYIYYDGKNKGQLEKVIDFNNVYRLLIGLPKRPYDENHNRYTKE